jgi:uncharacterized membrane protein YcaP (DUF421 family)
MDLVLRAIAIYLFLLVLVRLTGQRTLSELSTFDFILLLIVSEAVQNSLVNDDHSLVSGFIVVLTLVLVDLGLSMIKSRWWRAEEVAEGAPVVLVDQGRLLDDRLHKTLVTQDDILQAARVTQGLERIDQIKYAVLETSGGISIIPASRPEQEGLDERIERALQRVLDKQRDNHAGSA